MNEEICCINYEGKMAEGRMNGKMMALVFFELYAVYVYI